MFWHIRRVLKHVIFHIRKLNLDVLQKCEGNEQTNDSTK